jgi:hypothetical protein
LQAELAFAPVPMSWHDQQFLWITTLELSVWSALLPFGEW